MSDARPARTARRARPARPVDRSTGPPARPGPRARPGRGRGRRGGRPGAGVARGRRRAPRGRPHRARPRRCCKARSRRLLADLLRPHKALLKVLLGGRPGGERRPALHPLPGEGGHRPRHPADPGHRRHQHAVDDRGARVRGHRRAGDQPADLPGQGRAGSARTCCFELRRRVFGHFQRLSPAFHDEYTSGRVISRQTSDIDAIYEMLETGFDGLVTAVLTLVGVAVLLLVLDVKLGLVALLCFPFLLLLTNWFRRESAKTYRRTRETVALVIVHFVESMHGIRAVQAFRRESRNQEIFEDVNDQYRGRQPARLPPGRAVHAGHQADRQRHRSRSSCCTAPTWRSTARSPSACSRRSCSTCGSSSSRCRRSPSSTTPSSRPAPPWRSCPGCSRRSRASPSRPSRRRCPRPAETSASSAWSSPTSTGVPVLPGLDLAVPAGQTVALVGTTGAGKTTIAKLVSRFYDPTHGRGAARRGRPARARRADAAAGGGDGDPGELHVRRHRRRQHPVRPPGRQPRGGGRRRAGDRRPRVHQPAAAGLRHRRGQASGGRLSRGPAPARGLRAGVPRRPRRADPRRGDLARSTYRPSGWCSGPCARSSPSARR